MSSSVTRAGWHPSSVKSAVTSSPRQQLAAGTACAPGRVRRLRAEAGRRTRRGRARARRRGAAPRVARPAARTSTCGSCARDGGSPRASDLCRSARGSARAGRRTCGPRGRARRSRARPRRSEGQPTARGARARARPASAAAGRCDHQARAGEDAADVRLDDALVDAGRQPEVIRVYDQPPHRRALSRSGGRARRSGRPGRRRSCGGGCSSISAKPRSRYRWRAAASGWLVHRRTRS